MKPRIDATVAPGVVKAMLGVEAYLHQTELKPALLDLIRLRVSQINGCAYCIDMHWKDLRAIGESEQRLYGLDAWRESPYYTEPERAALAWAESVTRVADTRVPDEIYEEVRKYFSEKDVADLTLAVANINSWNRLNIALRTVPGSYQPAHHAERKVEVIGKTA
ncbi:MAG TPA: carboxymuconolactone decarboxylase family protein [Terriglobales bacterium]|jgi:AhpD family alkylhydroperoxidase|nr:carboxymuconolactone decarboxylase family protein [Terriglobales bacterium]